MEHEEGWAIRLAADIGRSVAYHRSGEPGAQGRRMSAQALADRCAELGLPIGRVAITKLENGIREKVSVAELLVLAAALEVPPVLLIFPVGREKAVEVLPARPLDPWHATLWLSGDARLARIRPGRAWSRPATSPLSRCTASTTGSPRDWPDTPASPFLTRATMTTAAGCCASASERCGTCAHSSASSA